MVAVMLVLAGAEAAGRAGLRCCAWAWLASGMPASKAQATQADANEAVKDVERKGIKA